MCKNRITLEIIVFRKKTCKIYYKKGWIEYTFVYLYHSKKINNMYLIKIEK